MRRTPLRKSDRNLIARLQGQLDELRNRFKISERGKVLFRAHLSYGDDEVVLVEADGFGGGILRVVEGNYPVDYLTRKERIFATEAEAEDAATLLCQKGEISLVLP
jgi:DNA-binding MarR family transcriptional regulator